MTTTLKRTVTSVAVGLGLLFSFPAQAQDPQKLLQGLFDSIKQSARPQSPMPTGANQQGIGLESAPTAKWPTRSAFLKAASDGEILRDQISLDREKFAYLWLSVAQILQADYGSPRIPLNDAKCRGEFSGNVIQAIKLMNEASLDVLSDRAPDFTNLEPGSSRRDLQFYLGRLKGDNRFCPVGAPVPGQRVPSYMEALFAFLPDFTQATSEWISSEQKRRQSEYLAQQADDKARKDAESQAIRDEQSRKDAAAKADQQRDIDATRARIEADQKRRQQIEKSRVGG